MVITVLQCSGGKTWLQQQIRILDAMGKMGRDPCKQRNGQGKPDREAGQFTSTPEGSGASKQA